MRSSNIKDTKKNLDNNSAEIFSLVALIETESINYSLVKLDYEQELRFLNANMTFSNVISEPFVADKKTFPVRWVVVAICSLAAFLMTFITIIIIERKRTN